MLRVSVSILEEPVEVDEYGRFELPNRQFTSADLKKIAREVNRAMRSANIEQELGQEEYE